LPHSLKGCAASLGIIMLTEQAAVEKEKDELFKQLRHFVSTQHSCPKHLTLSELYSILVLLKLDGE